MGWSSLHFPPPHNWDIPKIFHPIPPNFEGWVGDALITAFSAPLHLSIPPPLASLHRRGHHRCLRRRQPIEPRSIESRISSLRRLDSSTSPSSIRISMPPLESLKSLSAHSSLLSNLDLAFPAISPLANSTPAVFSTATIDLSRRRLPETTSQPASSIFQDLEKEDKVEHQHLKRYRSNMIDINEEIIFFEILTRLNVASLLRCKAVCKSWYILISDPSFVAAHLDHSKKKRKLAWMLVNIKQLMLKIYGFEEQGKRFRTCIFQKKLPKKRFTTRVLNSNGLLLVANVAESFICNLSTRDFTILPEGGHDSAGFFPTRCGFGLVPGTNVLKIAQYFYRSYNRAERTCSIGFEVLTFGVDSSWRVMAKDPPYPIVLGCHAVYAGGAIYFEIDNVLHTTSPEYILSFDLRDEKFMVIRPPFSLSSVKNPHVSWRLAGLEETLCFVYGHIEKGEVNIWLYKEHTWIHSFTFQHPQGIIYFPIIKRDEKLLFRVYDGEYKLELFDPESKSFEKLAHITGSGDFKANLARGYDNLQAFSYVESLEPASQTMKKI